ncbi:MAG: dihydroorotase [Lachnospiraceae bacterium]|nr:dihydroorotase [Lachnospiraceae bacterium]
MEKILIKNARIIDPSQKTDKTGDLLIENGIIEGIFGSADTKTSGVSRIIEGEGLCLAPGLVDVHVHFRDPGFTYKEDIHSGAEAAKKGGFTSVVMMANTKPSIDSPGILREVIERSEKEDINIYCAANITVSMQGREKTDIKKLREAGAVCFSDDGKPILDGSLLKQAFMEISELRVPASLHEEDPSFIENNGINEGEISKLLGIKGSDRMAEITMVKRDIGLAVETGVCLDIQHISTREAVELVRQGKRRGGDIHAEATPHHFTLTEKAVKEHGTNAKMNPPLRTEEDRLAIIEGLRDGTIDMIATDHAPHSREEKERDFVKAPSGITGLETALSLGITELVDKGYISLFKLIELMSTSPANIYGLKAGSLKKGCRADIVIFDPTEEWVFREGEQASKSSNSPFYGRKLKGKVCYTICGGKVVYEA